MPSPSSPVLQKFPHLDKLSQGSPTQLHDILYGKDYTQCLPHLKGDDLMWLVEYLDHVLDALDSSGRLFRKCLRELKNICSTKKITPSSYTISPGRLTIDSDPTSGGRYGDVYKGTLDGSVVCIKRLRKYLEPSFDSKGFFREAVMWKYMIHPNVLPLLGITAKPLQLLSEWMSCGTLPHYIKNFPDADRLKLIYEVAKGLSYLHSCNVIHGDLKGRNVLVDDSGRIRIADFGFAAVTKNMDSEGNSSTAYGCTPRWTAPEILNGGVASREGDIFSFAMVMIEVFNGAVPFSNNSNDAGTSFILEGKRPERPKHPIFTDELWLLMQRCWKDDPSSRPPTSEVLKILEVLTCRRLAGHDPTRPQRICLINAVFSDHNWSKVIDHVDDDCAQEFLDAVDEVLENLPPEVRKRCLCALYRLCGRKALIPRSLVLSLRYNLKGNPLYQGEFTDGLRVALSDDPDKTRRRFCREVMVWKTLRHPNVLELTGVTIIGKRLVMISEWMPNGNVRCFLEKNPDANRMELIGDTTKGLVYIHDQGIVHGNLRGENISIDISGRARLADFNLLRMISEEQTISLSSAESGNTRWMSPEIIRPVDLKEGHPTKASDCYSLGMVIYEILRGKAPFYQHTSYAVIMRILEGERPLRPQQGRFTDGIWEILELCWEHKPADRISAKAVLRYLEGGSALPDDLNGDAMMVDVGDQPENASEED